MRLPENQKNIANCAHCGLPVKTRKRPAKTIFHTQSKALEVNEESEVYFCCAGCRLVYNIVGETSDNTEENTLNLAMLRLGLGIFLTMNVMVFSFPFYGSGNSGPNTISASDAALHDLFRWLLLLLATCVMVLLGTPVVNDAIANLKQARIQASLLISMGAVAAYGLSVWSVLTGKGDIYFDSACMVLTLVTVGEYLDGWCKHAAAVTATSQLTELPDTAISENPDGSDNQINVNQIQLNQIIRITAGDKIPVDGNVTKGSGAVIESDLTGEALPRHVEVRDTVWAGSILTDGVLWISATATGKDRRVEQIAALLEHMRTIPLRIQRLTDRVSAWFVPFTIILALSAFSWTVWQDTLANAIFRGLAVILIACPCALGLAAPLVTWMTAHRLAQKGIIVKSGKALEHGVTIRDMIFDKTGTLTTGQFEIEIIKILTHSHENNNNNKTEANRTHPLAIAAALEKASNHPIAIAIRNAYKQSPSTTLINISDLLPLSGMGVSGKINNISYTLGRPDMATATTKLNSVPTNMLKELQHLHNIILWCDKEPIAIIGLREILRPNAGDVIRQLNKMGLAISVMTGDTSKSAAVIVKDYNLPVTQGLQPHEKRAALIQLRKTTKHQIAFVGDGVNDAPVLAEADLGIAMHSGSDLAKASGDVILLTDSLNPIIDLIQASRTARKRIIGSLTWAFAYNGLGLLTPAFAAIAMIVSSLFIIWNSTRKDSNMSGAGISPAKH